MALKVGIQLYSVRDAMAQNPIETCKTVANIGYKYLEFANHNGENDFGVGFGVSAEEVECFEKSGVRAIALNEGFTALIGLVAGYYKAVAASDDIDSVGGKHAESYINVRGAFEFADNVEHAFALKQRKCEQQAGYELT